jgi:NAD(P)-dependent dehydrogenase (short-subunit alcohol dehydrogenase family)
MKKTVLITGANSGFGYLTALKFAREGYKVFATTRSIEKSGVKDLNEIAMDENLAVEWLVLDVTNEEHRQIALSKIIEYGSLDVLVNNAGYALSGKFDELTTDDVRVQFETNFFGVLSMVNAFLPLLKESQGRIINLSSVVGRISPSNLGAYASSKHALEGYSEALSGDLRKFNIEVVVIEPGGFDTNFGKNVVSLGEKEKESFPNSSAAFLKMIRNPQIVANKIYKVSNCKYPKLRYLVGVDATLIGFAKKIMPERLLNAALKRVTV